MNYICVSGEVYGVREYQVTTEERSCVKVLGIPVPSLVPLCMSSPTNDSQTTYLCTYITIKNTSTK